MSERDLTLYFVDILIAIDKIRRYTKNFNNSSDFLRSELEWDATIRELQIIGDATNAVLKFGTFDKKFRRIVDFRNQIVHGYFGINEELVWEVVNFKLDELEEEIKKVIKKSNFDLTNSIDAAIIENNHNEEVIKFLKKLK